MTQGGGHYNSGAPQGIGRLGDDLLKPAPQLAQRPRRRHPVIAGAVVVGRVQQQPLPAVPRVLKSA
jgi:hypothetical protein